MNNPAEDAKFLRYIAASFTYNDTTAEAEAKHRLHEIAMRLETEHYGYRLHTIRYTGAPKDWTITRKDKPPFQAIELRAPNGYQTIVYSHERNPSNILYMLADDLLKGYP